MEKLFKTTKLSTRKNIRTTSSLQPTSSLLPFSHKAYVSTRTPEIRRRQLSLLIAHKHNKFWRNFTRKQSMSSYSSYSYEPSKSVTNCYISLVDLGNQESFNDRIKNSNLSKDQRYIVYIKVRYNIDMFFMVGNQFGFYYKSSDSFIELYDNINIKLDEYFSSYNLTDNDIIYIQISFRLLNKATYNSLKLIENSNTSLAEHKRLKSVISIPVFKGIEDLKQLGVCLPVHLDANNNITSIDIILNGIKTNF